jgi:peroxiredoxin family protein
MSGGEFKARKVGIIINTFSYERVSNALSLATVYATLGYSVIVFFWYEGVLRLRRGLEDEGWREKLPRISDQLRILRSYGGRVYVCPAAMAYHNLTIEDLTNEIDGVRGLVEFLVDVKDGTVIYV